MGSRIQKKIGFYLSKDKVNLLFLNNYEDIMNEDLHLFNSDLAQQILSDLEEFKNDLNKSAFRIDETYLKMFQKQDLVINIQDLISEVVFYDEFQGILFQTPELHKSNRSNDLMDYYENVDNIKNNIQFLKSNIYPYDHFICVQNPVFTEEVLKFLTEEPNEKIPGVGDIVYNNYLFDLMNFNQVKDCFQSPNPWVYPEDNTDKYFHPYISIIIYLIAKRLNILNTNISYSDFSGLLEPVIITSWS